MPDDRTYIKLHDGICRHPKVVGLSDKAFRAYIEALCYCSEYLTDGEVVKSLATKMAPPRAWAELTTCGLVDVTDSGYEMHDYLEHQRSAEQVRQLKETRRAAGSRGGKAKARGVASASRVATDSPEQTDTKDVPETESLTYVRDQTDTDPSLRSGAAPEGATPTDKPKTSRRKPQRAIADDFAITEKMRDWHRGRGISDYDADRQTERFVRDAQAKDKRMSNWDQAWRNWLDQAVDWGQVKAGPKLAAANGDRTWTAAELDALLGPDMWRLPQPPKGMPGPEIWDWEQRVKAEHRAERVRQANEKLGRTA